MLILFDPATAAAVASASAALIGGASTALEGMSKASAAAADASAAKLDRERQLRDAREAAAAEAATIRAMLSASGGTLKTEQDLLGQSAATAARGIVRVQQNRGLQIAVSRANMRTGQLGAGLGVLQGAAGAGGALLKTS